MPLHIWQCSLRKDPNVALILGTTKRKIAWHLFINPNAFDFFSKLTNLFILPQKVTAKYKTESNNKKAYKKDW